MVSILAQERLLGAALGAILTGVVVFEERRSIYSLISQNQPQIEVRSEPREPIPIRNYRSEFAHLWNNAVDKTLGPVIVSLSSRGW